ncbi:TPA: RHS repeat-associated core domain-containing protein [Proteus mirabilis]
MVHQHGFRAKTWYYQWNTLNQLIACFNPEGECWRYTYDAFGRRLSKSKVVDNRPITPPNSPFKNKRVQRVDYLWSGDQMVQETPIYADGTPAYDSQIQWLYQPGEITPTARYQRGKLHYVVTDHQGTPREIFSEKGIVSWAGRLNTWGQMAFWQSHDDYADNDPEYTECHFRFAGQYEDKESGLYYNRFRYYDKDTGQYISPDPIGLLGGFNPYGYVYCPTGWVDPFGLAGSPYIFDSKQLQKKFKHAIDFGVTGNANKIGIAKFEIAMKNHMNLSSTIKIKGQYRWDQDVYHYFNPETNLNVMIDMDGKFISGWKLSEKQTTDLLEKGNVF